MNEGPERKSPEPFALSARTDQVTAMKTSNLSERSDGPEGPAASWTYFPLYAVTDGVCACPKGAACRDAGKHPRISWGSLAAGAAIKGQPGEGRGIATGHRSGVFVLDVDNKPGGANGFETLRALGELPPTYTVKTPTGGAHLYFQIPPGRVIKTSGGALGPGLDVRGEGGYVVGPGSKHKNGGVYEVADSSKIEPAPAWLLARPELYAPPKGELVDGASNHVPISPDHPRWEELYARGVDACQTSDPSKGDGAASKMLGEIIKKLLWDFGLPPETVLDLVTKHFDTRCTYADGLTPWPWGEEEIARFIKSSLKMPLHVVLAPPGWPESFNPNRAKPKPVQSTTRRTVRNPAHEYTCSLGDVPNGDKKTTDIANLISIMVGHEEWAGVWQYDKVKGRVRAVDPPIKLQAEEPEGLSDTDITAVRTWCSCVGGLTVSKDAAWDAVLAAAHVHAYNPIQEWLESLPPHQGPSLFEGISGRIFGADNALYDTYLRKFMMAAIRRAFNPGEKVDNVLVLQSPDQGDGKSTFAVELFGKEWLTEDLPQSDIGHKDNSLALATTWCVELAELDKLLRGHLSAVKSFLSRLEDTYREPYGRTMISKPRQCVFVGTTNETDFLRDPSGSRRYWCIPVRHVSLGWIKANREALWAEAYQAALTTNGTVLKPQGEYLEREQHWLTSEEDSARKLDAEQFTLEDMNEDPVAAFLRGKPWVKLSDVLQHVRLTDPNARQTAVKNTLLRLGARSYFEGPERIRAWRVPSRLAEMQPVRRGLHAA